MSKKAEEVKKEVVTYTPEDFSKALEELSKKMGYRLNIVPDLFQQDNGTFSLRIITTVSPIK